jgi:HPt (histidine-containing phosphotransfer) domain-containing protein
MDGYLSKPVDSQALFNAVEAGAAPTGGESIAPHDIFDRAGLLGRLAGDEEVVQDVERLFLEDAPIRLQAIENAVKGRDAAAIRFEAHGLKGAAGSLMAPRLFEAAKALETLGEESRLDGVEAAMQTLSVEAARVLDALRRSIAQERKIA